MGDFETGDITTDSSLSFEDLARIEAKSSRARLGFGALLRFRRLKGRFPRDKAEISAAAITHLADQIGVSAAEFEYYDLTSRSSRRHRVEILDLLGMRRMTRADRERYLAWLETELCPQGLAGGPMLERAALWFNEQRIACPEHGDLALLIETSRRRFEHRLLEAVADSLSPQHKATLDASLADEDEVTGFNGLKADPGRVGLESVLLTAKRLAFVRSLGLPRAAMPEPNSPVGKGFRRRVAHENAWRMRQHPDGRRHALYAIFLAHRERELTDELVDLLIEIIHKISARAERKVVAGITKEVQKVHGKERLLVRIAEAAIKAPDGAVCDVIFPVVDQATLAAVVREYRAGGSYRRRVHAVLRASYGGHYRRMLPAVLDVLEFRSNNAAHRPVLEALSWLKRLLDDNHERRVIRLEDGLPIEDVIPARWRDLVMENDGAGGWRIDRINYEICVLTALRERIRCKEIWVVGADRYRNPDEDLPRDFDEHRAAYYRDLGRTEDATAFVDELQAEMTMALRHLDAGMPHDRHVRLLWRGQNRISLSLLKSQPTPPNLEAVKSEIERRWPMTGLIDVLKEAALRTGFLEEFKTSGDRMILDRPTLRCRLLLCLYGLGMNAGLKRVSAGTEDVTYAELLHVRSRFIDRGTLRAATGRVTNALLAVRDPRVWGEGTTACASDSKKVGAWDQNLMTEWHIRYGGRGVMIYWYVARQAACIYSQLKRCSSSEVAAMIEGVLRHCTDAEIQRQYVDSHGQSEVAFAFCRLLGFELAPRLKAIARQRLYLPAAGMGGRFPNLDPILTRAIDWDLIGRQYDEMIKYAAALRHRTAEPEVILRRFARASVQHPTYKALAELGKAVKTVFLCRYLGSEAFRREIHEGLNVVENWNSANGFIFFGKGGEVASNRLEDQEVSVLALHLLQSCLVYVNTLMMQRVLAEPAWSARMTREDYRGLTPLIYAHVNPYGTFDLDLERRIDLDLSAAA